MATDYWPRTDAGVVGFSSNFSTLINADPVAYGLTIEQADQYRTLSTEFSDLWLSTQNPNGNDSANIAAKNNKRDGLEAYTRELVRLIQANPATTNNQREELGITVKDVTPTPAPKPGTPELIIESSSQRIVKFRLRDPENPSRRGKPQYVIGATIMSHVGPTPPANPEDWKMEFQTSRTLGEVEFAPSVPSGSTVWLTAYWFNTRMEPGHAAPAVSTQLPGTMPEQQQAA